ncbi:secreted frizzled-related protein 1-like [Physella acuta]|uniref:secreted frizzled-related protein 1-like n=1 Tax=Physella acuta TaxID=109671 RepID=UPI0027DAC79E|nr:secreted frizzled-related protein 1-like [Physella acuta]
MAFKFSIDIVFLLSVYIYPILATTADSYRYGKDSYSYDYFYGNNNGAGEDEYASDWSTSEWGKLNSRTLPSKCVDIPSNLTLCQGIGYKKMLLPNILDHDSLYEVTQQAGSWVPLININCHPDTKVFLCSLFSPVCLERLIYPCRTLCESVQAACAGRMKTYGFGWPDMLKCDRFPLDNDMCIKLIHDVKPDNNCSACRHPLTHEAMIDHFCRADIVLRATIKEFKENNGHMELVLHNKRNIYKTAPGKKEFKQQTTAIIEGGAGCTCETINSTQERYLLMGTWKDEKLVINFGIVWNKKDKEFKKGLRQIRKGNTCEIISKDLLNNGVEPKPTAGAAKDGQKKKKVNNGNGKKDKEKDKKGKKGTKKKNNNNEKKGKANKKNKNKKNKEKGSSKSELEDRALSTFIKAAR